MIPATRTITVTPNPGIKRSAMTLTSRTQFPDAGMYQAFNRMQRPLYQFEMSLGPLTKTEVQCITALHALHQGGRSFFWDGGAWGNTETYQVFGEADGSRTQYYLPNRYIGAGSLSVQTYRPSTGATSVWASGYALNANAGLVTFTTVPVSGDDIMAKWGCKYRVHFDPEVLAPQEIAAGLWTLDLRLIESGLTS